MKVTEMKRKRGATSNTGREFSNATLSHKRPRLSRGKVAGSSKLQHKRKHGLPRPKTPLSFSMPQAGRNPTQTSKSTTNPVSTSSSTIDRLNSVVHILNLINRRNKNQHRNQPFWKHFSLLRRSLTKLLALHEALASTTSSATRQTAADVRKRFETEQRLRTEKDIYEDYIRETLLPQCYVRFSTVVGDVQFANLGLVLMGVAADIAGLVGTPRTNAPTPEAVSKANETTDSPVRILSTSVRVTGRDQGKVVKHVYDASSPMESDDDGDDFGKVIERPDAAEPVTAAAGGATVPSEDSRAAEIDSHKAAGISGLDKDSLAPKNSSSALLKKSEKDTIKKPATEKGSKAKKKKKGGAFDDLFKGLI